VAERELKAREQRFRGAGAHATGARWRTFACGLSALASVGQGCLVTNNVDYDRPNTPALVTKILPMDFTAVTQDCTTNNRPGMSFTVSVYDPDLIDKLFVRVFVNNETPFTTRVSGTQAQRDPFTHCVPYEQLNVECSHVEVLVSNEFTEVTPADHPRDTADPYDVGRVEWWLVGPAETFPEVGVSNCQKTGQGAP
jgi:hypothetical protein